MSVSASPPPDTVSLDAYRRLMTRYERLMAISRQLNSTLDLGALLKLIVHAAADLTETEEASILLLDPASGELRFEAASAMSRAEMAAIPVPIEGSLAGWVVTHGEPVLVANAQDDARWFPRVDKTTQFHTRNLLAVPLSLQNQAIGVIEAINKRGGQPWTDDDVNTLATLADQAAIAVQNARLFQQSDFISEVVHELRTPLAALRASASLLARPAVQEGRRAEIARGMQRETERLTQLTTDFLDLARLESGRARLNMTVFDVRALLDECAEIVAPRAAERGLALALRGDPELAEADRAKIKQVLLNLLTNAIKYNVPAGEIEGIVGEGLEQYYCEPDCLIVAVRDTGPGIRPEDQPHIFEKFYRASLHDKETTGTGLGLVIAQRIVQAHGCAIGFESEPGRGTLFYFTLPRAHSASAGAQLPGSAGVSVDYAD